MPSNMRGSKILVLGAVVLALPVANAVAQPGPGASAVIHADRLGAKIDRHIFGQFAEHLGRGLEEGVWVGEHSAIPNIRGIRKDVIAALRDLHVPVVRWPGWLLLRTNTTGATASGFLAQNVPSH